MHAIHEEGTIKVAVHVQCRCVDCAACTVAGCNAPCSSAPDPECCSPVATITGSAMSSMEMGQ